MTEKTLAEVHLDALELLRGTFERTMEGYTALLKRDAMQVLAGVTEPRSSPERYWNNVGVRAWGKEAFPDFKLSPEDRHEVGVLAAALKAGSNEWP